METATTSAGQPLRTENRELPAEAALEQWLCEGGGSLPGEFLRLHGLNPAVLVSERLLRRARGRWSDTYVSGPLLHARGGQ